MVSDLPMLITMFEPGMRVASIEAMTEEDFLTGIRMRLMKMGKESVLDLVQIGSQAKEYQTDRKGFAGMIDRVSILSDTEGVCDVIIYDGNDGIRQTNLTKNNRYCKPGQTYIEDVTLSVSAATPLVGFHGRVNNSGIVQLGLIFYDDISDECKKSTSDSSSDMSLIDGMSD